MGCRHAPAFGFARGFHGVANVLAVAKRCFSKQTLVRTTYRHAVTRIWPHLLAADEELHGAIDRGNHEVSWLFWRLVDGERLCEKKRRLLEPRGLKIFAQTFAPAFASETAFAIATEAAGGVEKICAVDPNHAGFELCCNVQ